MSNVDAITPDFLSTRSNALTPALVQAVLREIDRQGSSGDLFDQVFVEALADDDAGLRVVVGVETAAAIERSRSVRPFIELFIAQVPGWAPAPRVEGRLLPCTRTARELKLEAMLHTIYAVMAGAYDSERHDHYLERLQDDCEGANVETTAGMFGDDSALEVAAHVASDLVAVAWFAPKDADAPVERNCLVFATQATRRLADYLLEHVGREAAEQFIAGLRAISPASAV
jgi:hypothetical protein